MKENEVGTERKVELLPIVDSDSYPVVQAQVDFDYAR